VLQESWAALVALTIWALHYRMAASDRGAVGERGASATLRRWYMYAVLLTGLLVMLSGASTTLQLAWAKGLHSDLYSNMRLSTWIAPLAAGLLVWGFHGRAISRRHIADDRQSTLRAVEGFIAVTVSIAVALVGGSQILYYSLARILGVQNPGGLGNDILAGLA